jgi:hypothetical protein
MQTGRNANILIAPHGVARRRFRSKQERRQIVEESFQPGVSVAVIAKPHGVNANQVFHWRKHQSPPVPDLQRMFVGLTIPRSAFYVLVSTTCVA